ncbi:MAG: protein translocase subunit SecF [Patescibacteria group bacterium]
MIDIVNKRKYFYTFSIALTIVSLIMLFAWGLKFGIDFKGGTLMEMQFSQGIPNDQQIEDKIKNLNLSSLTVQASQNNSVILKYNASDENLNNKVREKIKELDPNYKETRIEFIGSSVSNQIKKNAILAVVLANIGIGIFIAWAFRKVSRPVPSWQYGIGAVIALIHDVLITTGVFVFLGRFHNVEVGVSFIAALLTILGFSVHDTIVVYDRIRENLLKSGKGESFEEIVNKSLNETITRSINTSLTVILVLFSIVLFGGETIRYFSMALLVGIFFGTYSSIFVASALLVTSYKLKLKKA